MPERVEDVEHVGTVSASRARSKLQDPIRLDKVPTV
jgi:hypothetical protein